MATKISGYDVLYTNADVAASPDTTLLTNVDGFNIGDRDSGAVDLLKFSGGGSRSNAGKIQLIFSHSSATDADATTSVFECHGSADGGPRQALFTLALTGGKARVNNASDLVTWVDTATATDLRTTGVVVDDSATDRMVRVTLDINGLRYIQGLFTGAGSTAITAIAYYRFYSEE